MYLSKVKLNHSLIMIGAGLETGMVRIYKTRVAETTDITDGERSWGSKTWMKNSATLNSRLVAYLIRGEGRCVRCIAVVSPATPPFRTPPSLAHSHPITPFGWRSGVEIIRSHPFLLSVSLPYREIQTANGRYFSWSSVARLFLIMDVYIDMNKVRYSTYN